MVVVGSAVVVVVSGSVVVVVSGAVVVVGARVVVVASSVRMKVKLFAELTTVLIAITMAPVISQYYLSPPVKYHFSRSIRDARCLVAVHWLGIYQSYRRS